VLLTTIDNNWYYSSN